MGIRMFRAEGRVCAKTRSRGHAGRMRAVRPWGCSNGPCKGRMKTWDVTLRAAMAAARRDRQTTLPSGTAEACLVLSGKLLVTVEKIVQEANADNRETEEEETNARHQGSREYDE